jgi:hypothetical protein
MKFCRIALLCAMCWSVWAASGYTVQQIKQFVQSAIELQNPDKEVAETLRKMKLSERLDLDTVEALQGQGAGPKTVAVLKELAAETGKSSPSRAAPAKSQPTCRSGPPSSEEQAKLLDECARLCRQLYAQAARFHLPGADPPLCRHHRPGLVAAHRYHLGAAQLFQPEGRLQADFAERPGDHRRGSYTSVGGATSTGDFGTTMERIFDPKEQHA